jgi:hypothetical protein
MLQDCSSPQSTAPGDRSTLVELFALGRGTRENSNQHGRASDTGTFLDRLARRACIPRLTSIEGSAPAALAAPRARRLLRVGDAGPPHRGADASDTEKRTALKRRELARRLLVR